MASESGLTAAQLAEFKTFGTKGIEEQMKIFLRAFWKDDDVDLKKVFLFANYFHLRLSKDGKTEFELDQAADLFQKLEDAKPSLQLKAELRKYDHDSNGKMSFVEFCLMRFNKSVTDLVTRDIDGDPDLIKELRAAKDAVNEIKANIASLNAKADGLQEQIDAGGVKKFSAQQEQGDIRNNQIPELNKKLGEAEKVEKKAQAKRDEFGSLLDKDLAAAGLTEYNSKHHAELWKDFNKLEKNL